MVVLDAIHQIQARRRRSISPCAGIARRASARKFLLGGNQRLAEADVHDARLNSIPLDRPVTVEPMKAFPHIRDLVTDVSWNYEVKKKIKQFKPRASRRARTDRGAWRRRTWIECREFRKMH